MPASRFFWSHDESEDIPGEQYDPVGASIRANLLLQLDLGAKEQPEHQNQLFPVMQSAEKPD